MDRELLHLLITTCLAFSLLGHTFSNGTHGHVDRSRGDNQISSSPQISPHSQVNSEDRSSLSFFSIFPFSLSLSLSL